MILLSTVSITIGRAVAIALLELQIDDGATDRRLVLLGLRHRIEQHRDALGDVQTDRLDDQRIEGAAGHAQDDLAVGAAEQRVDRAAASFEANAAVDLAKSFAIDAELGQHVLDLERREADIELAGDGRLRAVERGEADDGTVRKSCAERIDASASHPC